MPIITTAQATGHTCVRQIAAYLNQRGILTARGKTWMAGSVQQLLVTATG